MSMRPYQQAAIDALYNWWQRHPGIDQAPILAVPPGGGKSWIIAELTRLLWDTWPDEKPRTLILVPSKELAEQNAEKLAALLPAHLHLDYYSAAIGRKRPDADVIVATIGSVYRHAHLLGNIKCVIVDECFTADTTVSTPSGDVRIEDIKPGDTVYTATGTGTIQAVNARKSQSLCIVKLNNGASIRTTDNHPFFTHSGWVRAKDLARGDGLVRLQDVPTLWDDLSAMGSRYRDRKGVSDADEAIVREGSVLLDLLFQESRERHEHSWGQGEDGGNAKAEWTQAVSDRWKRTGIDRTAESDPFDFVSWLETGTCHQDWRTKDHENLSDLLQGGYWERISQDRDRTGRRITQREKKIVGQEEGQVPRFAWVEGVSREELESPELVFNLQVSGHPSYFAGGVLVHNCHLISPDGAGRYRQLLSDLAKLCRFRAVGLTATPFRGNGVWLTEGRDPLFTGIAYSVPMGELIDAGYLAPLVRPIDDIQTRIDTSGISTSSGDYQIDALEQRVQRYLVAASDETIKLASDRQKWLAFCPTVATAEELVGLFTARGIATVLVTGETPKKERARHVADFRAGQIRCLVTVLALATGFDVPDVDCLIWLRPTISPVLFVQGSGRGLRIAPGKNDALWIDFSDTTQRLGPIDQIKGRKKGKGPADPQAPFAICDNCGAQVRPASALECPECGAVLREPEEKTFSGASIAPILGRQQAQRVRHPVSRVTYHRHVKPGSPDSMRVEYWSGLRVVAKEWVCFEHPGFAGEKARRWIKLRARDAIEAADFFTGNVSTSRALELLHGAGTSDGSPWLCFETPKAIHVNESGKYPEIIAFEWENNHDAH